MHGPSFKVRRVLLQESALQDVFVVVLDDTGRSENEKMNMTVLNPLCHFALTTTHGCSRQANLFVHVMRLRSYHAVRSVQSVHGPPSNNALDLSVMYSIYSSTCVANKTCERS